MTVSLWVESVAVGWLRTPALELTQLDPRPPANFGVAGSYIPLRGDTQVSPRGGDTVLGGALTLTAIT